MEDGAPPHRLLPGGGASPGHVGEPRGESSRAGATLCPGPSSCLYAPKCVEGVFCEVGLLLTGVLGSSASLAALLPCVQTLRGGARGKERDAREDQYL